MHIPEELLHFIWRFRIFDQTDLKSTDNVDIKIISTGSQNYDGGPDFSYAKLLIGNTEWVGDVELHILEKHWSEHKHHRDENYNKVVLHVVWQLDQRQYRQDNTVLPTLELQKYVEKKLLIHYQDLMKNKDWIPCASHLSKISVLDKEQVLGRMGVERLEFRYLQIVDRLEKNIQNWEKIFHTLFFRAFGMKVNAEAFERLSEVVSMDFLFRKREHPHTISALLFGQAGFLNNGKLKDRYYQDLRREFLALREGMHLPSMSLVEWKYLRMRPYNFPSYRLAQLAAVLSQYPLRLSVVLETEDVKKITEALAAVEMDVYWQTHFRFGKTTSKKKANISENFILHLTINVFALVKFAYGKYFNQYNHCETAINWLQQIKAENNALVRKFRELSMPLESVSDSQGVLHLHSEYCHKKRCLECDIGRRILSR